MIKNIDIFVKETKLDMKKIILELLLIMVKN